jgi:hypothetical protein
MINRTSSAYLTHTISYRGLQMESLPSFAVAPLSLTAVRWYQVPESGGVISENQL